MLLTFSTPALQGKSGTCLIHGGGTGTPCRLRGISRAQLRVTSGSIWQKFLVLRFERQTVKEDPNCFMFCGGKSDSPYVLSQACVQTLTLADPHFKHPLVSDYIEHLATAVHQDRP